MFLFLSVKIALSHIPIVIMSDLFEWRGHFVLRVIPNKNNTEAEIIYRRLILLIEDWYCACFPVHCYP